MDDLLEMAAQFFTEERIVQILEQDGAYMAAQLREVEAHDRLERILTDEQVELLNAFTDAADETVANMERINYQQGMKDLFALFRALSR